MKKRSIDFPLYLSDLTSFFLTGILINRLSPCMYHSQSITIQSTVLHGWVQQKRFPPTVVCNSLGTPGNGKEGVWDDLLSKWHQTRHETPQYIKFQTICLLLSITLKFSRHLRILAMAPFQSVVWSTSFF